VADEKNFKDRTSIAIGVFNHQTIFHTKHKCLTPLNNIDSDKINALYIPYLGKIYDDGTAQKVYTGSIHPSTYTEVFTIADNLRSIFRNQYTAFDKRNTASTSIHSQ
jgi:hypothetical protein